MDLPDLRSAENYINRELSLLAFNERVLAQAMDERVPTFAITHETVSPQAAAERLGERGFAVWHGDYYAVEIMQRLGLEDGAVRIGIVHYNTEDEVARLLAALAEL